MIRLGRIALLPVLAAALSPGCGAPSVSGPAAAPVPTIAPAPTATMPSAAAPVPAPAATPASWVMPNLVGVNLQDAQDRIQTLTGSAIFFTTSHDASGKGREQVVDRNWKVCDQNIEP